MSKGSRPWNAPIVLRHKRQAPMLVVLDAPHTQSGVCLYPRGSMWTLAQLRYIEGIELLDGVRLWHVERRVELLIYNGVIWNVTNPDEPREWRA